MKRFIIPVLCSVFFMLPTAPAHAGTWSWHSDAIEYIIEMIRSNHQDTDGGKQSAPVQVERQGDRTPSSTLQPGSPHAPRKGR